MGYNLRCCLVHVGVLISSGFNRIKLPFQWAFSASGLGLRETISGTRIEVRRLSTATTCHGGVKTKVIKLNYFLQLGNQLNQYTVC